jgi:putative flippase GtrA
VSPKAGRKMTLSQVARIGFSSHLGKYFLIGGTASAIDVGVFIVLHEFLGMAAIASHSVSIPLAAIFSFTCNAYLNFKKTDKLLLRLISFSNVILLGYLLGAAVIWLFDDVLLLGGTVGKLVSLPFVFLFQYFLNAKISFRG